jgi:hypothetical protein
MRRRTPRHRPRPRRGARAAAVLTALLVLVCTPAAVVVLASGQTAAAPSHPPRPGSRDPLRPAAPFFANAGDGVRPDGIGCSSAGASALRARAHLDVFADGARVTVPAGIGVLASCRYWLHTVADDGVIQIGSPARRRFTLGDLFDIWGAPLTRDRVLGFALGARRGLRAFVDGRRVAGDPRAIGLRDGREIALVIGRAPAHVPRRFTAR